MTNQELLYKATKKANKHSDEVANGDADDDKEVEDERDPNDHVVDDNGFSRNWVQTRPIDNQALLYKLNRYSDEVANGDEADDKDLHEEEDMNDDVVDLNGGTNRGYGSHVVMDYLPQASRIEPFHFGTVPRAFVQTESQLGKYSDEIANGDEADDKDLHEEEDWNDDVVDEMGQTNRGYGSHVVMSYLPHATYIEPIHFGTVPREETPNQQQPGE